MVNWQEMAERYKFMYDVKCRECDEIRKQHQQLLDALANPEMYELDNLEAQNEL